MQRLALLLALPALLACVPPPDGARLVGSQWTFTAIDGAAPVSDRTSLDFEADRIGVNVGCNGMGGEWRIANGRIVTDGMISTMMYCDTIAGQERAVLELLEGRPTVTLTGDRLVLRSNGHSAELRRQR